MKAVVVTGASTGIGEASVKMLIKKGFTVFAAVRNEADAAKIAAQHNGAAEALLFDVTDEPAVAAAAKKVEEKLAGATLTGLVNNAGFSAPAPLLHMPLDDFRRQLAVNVTGQLAVIQAFAPLLGAGARRASSPGRIVNMSSVAGRFATPMMGAYCASKFALEGLSDALRRELMIYGVDVILIEPGAIATPIWEKSAADLSRYSDTDYGPVARRAVEWAQEMRRNAPPPEKVAEAVLRALTARRPPVRIPVVEHRFTGYTLPHLLPARLLDWLTARRLGLKPRENNQSARTP